MTDMDTLDWDVSRNNRPDYRHWRKDHVTILPAIHSSYLQYSARNDVATKLQDHGFLSFADFNFLSKDGLYLYDAALYSAGGADLNVEKSRELTPGIWDRRDDTMLMSDSGGFQVLTGVWTPKDYYEKREQILRWQEEISDIGIAMDVPSGCVNSRKAKSIESVDEALFWSKANFTWQVKNRNPSKMRMLNVIQGLEIEGQNGVLRWYDEVKGYCDRRQWGERAFDGWSFGGYAARDTQAALRVISRMLQDGFLGKHSNHRWIHVLGVTSAKRVATFTLIQKALRQILGDEDFTVSCDSSNGCFAVGTKGNYYTDGGRGIVQRKVLHAQWFQPTCGKDCRIYCTADNPDCGPCIEQRIRNMITMFGTSTLNFHMPFEMILDLVNYDEAGRLSPLGYLAFMNISMEMFLRYAYRSSSKIVDAKAGVVSQLVAALKSETPESDLAKIKLA
ncbi:hypothetical protein [Paramagnetospirillum magneticum]|nr:hypothetical protein [Paramagnetospirillum magneticum]